MVHSSGRMHPIILFFVCFMPCLLTALDQGSNQLQFHQHGNSFSCVDHSPKCSYWATKGECFANPAWMMRNCRRSCQACQGSEKAWELRNKLIAQYNQSTQDTKQESVGTVTIHTATVNHIEMNEQDQTVRIFGTLLMAWNDSRVKWDNQEWGISWLNLVWSQVWIPRLVSVTASSTRMVLSDFTNKAVALHHSGQVFVWVDFGLQTFGSMDYSKFPYDHQTACFRFGDLRDFNLEFEVDKRAEEALRQSVEKLHPAGWSFKSAEIFEEKHSQKLIAADTDDLVDVAASTVDMCITVKRDTAYFGATYLAPCAATSLITIVAILAQRQWNKVLLLVTSLALQTLFLDSLDGRLPPASGKTPLFVKFCSCNMAITCFILLMELVLCSLETVRATLPPPRCLMIPASRLSNALPTVLTGSDHSVKLQEDQRVDNLVDLSTPPNAGNLWLPVVRSVRFIAFIGVITFYLLLFAVTFVF